MLFLAFVYRLCELDVFLRRAQRTGMTIQINCEVHVAELMTELRRYCLKPDLPLFCLSPTLHPPADLTTGTVSITSSLQQELQANFS